MIVSNEESDFEDFRGTEFIEMQGLASLQKLLDLSNKSNASTNERINLS